MKMYLDWKYLLFIGSFICYVKGQCNTRNYRAAIEVRRPCSKQCIPGSTVGGKSCRSSRVCTCDHECGYSCVPRNSFCPSPPLVENSVEVKVRRRSSNGSLVLVSGNSFQYDDMAEYVCRPGYKRDFPVMQHFCHSRNRWTGITVCILSCQQYSFSGVNRNNMSCGNSCKIDDDCRGILKCRCDGFCSRSCVNPNVNCGEAPAARNAIVTYTGSGIEREAHYRCREGFYQATGTATRKCTGGGTWNGQDVFCQQVACGDPRPSIQATGGDVVNWQPGPYRVGQTFTFSCPSTHQMLGSRVRTCLSTGRWSGLLTVCDNRGETIRCHHPGVPINGRITSINLQVGSFVEFQCKPGYSMYGESRQECLYFLQWSDNGAPKCINSKYSLNEERVIDKLLHDTEVPSIGKSISNLRSSIYETYFIIDISDAVRDDVLRKSLKFGEEIIKNMSRNGRIRCEISAFASNRLVLLDLQTTTMEEAVERLNNVRTNRQNILEELDGRRNTHRAIEALNTTLDSSFSEDPDLIRYVFLFVNGPHGQGESPKAAMDNIRSIYEGYLLEIYVIAFGEEFQNDHTISELRSLAPKGNFLANPFIDLFKESPADTSEREYSDCGRAGDVENIKNRAAIGKVIGGSFAIDGAWPWQVVFSLYRQNVYSTFNGPISVFGGGSLINNEWVITAAHIFTDVRRLNNWPLNILLTLGTTRLLRRRSSDLSPHTRVFLPDRVIIHENYVKGTFDYDIALVKLGREQEPFGDIWLPSERSGRVEYTKRIQRVCLPCTENNCVGKYLRKIGKLNGNEGKEERCRIEGEWLFQEGDLEEKNILTAVTGFGYTDESNPVISEHLKQGLIRLRNNNRCRRDRELMLRHQPPLPRRVAFTERMTCGVGGGLNSVVDACTGDSGGPLVREIIDEESGESCWVLVGIVSWGLNCGTSYKENNTKKHFPGFYSKVTSFTTWISEHISKDEECQERNLENLEPSYKCKKSCQNTNDCTGVRRRCICDNFCGMSCVNPNALCRGLDPFENGVITGNRTYGSNITYNCNRGYVLEGASQRTCRSDRTFSGSTPICRQIRCTVPDPPAFGSAFPQVPSLPIGGLLTYFCNPDYQMVDQPSGHLIVTCLKNMQWSNNVPRCRELRCTAPEAPRFGSISTNKRFFRIGESITFSCDAQYEMEGRPLGTLTVQCQRNGEWSDRTPICREIRCNVPNSPAFGLITPRVISLRVGETITYTCHVGYEIVNQPSDTLIATCLPTKQWSSGIPRCRVVLCIVPDPPAFGSTSPEVPFLPVGGFLTYSCNPYYQMVNQPSGHLVVTCQNNKQWSSGVPQCTKQRCIVPKAPRFGSISTNRRSVLVKDTITFTCDARYEMVGKPSGSLTVQCQRNGGWSDRIPTCRVTRCNVPNSPAFGLITPRVNSLPVGRTITYTCRVGYAMVNQPSNTLTATCLPTKQWSSRVPQCADLSECGQAGAIGNTSGSARVRRAIGGEDARPGAWPWQAVICRRSVSVFLTYNKNLMGGGSVINNRWVLTAAQLFSRIDTTDPKSKELFLLTLGLHRSPRSVSDVLPSTVQVYGPEEIFVNPQYAIDDYDVALIKVGQRFVQEGYVWVAIGPSSNVAIQFTNFVRPVCLPCMNNSCIREELKRERAINGRETEVERCAIEKNFLLRGTNSNTANAVATGFGSTESSGSNYPQYLQQVVLQVRDNQHCRTVLAELGLTPKYTPRMLCADSSHSTEARDTCQGDSGGPLAREVFNAGTKKSCWVQIGIVSWGYGCARTVTVIGDDIPMPGYYANVIELMPWIKEILANN